MTPSLTAITPDELDAMFRIKYGDPAKADWGPRMRHAFGYFTPDDHYDTLVNRLVGTSTRWLDVGCGRTMFPSNPALARMLADRCAHLVGVDPDHTLDENPFVHAKVKVPIADYRPEQRFDLVTLRMVAEHITEPTRTLEAIANLTNRGGHLVVYTVNRFSPVPLLTGIVPFALHHPIKRVLWRSLRKDTFPTCFRMNTRRRLAELAQPAGFREVFFAYLDDCRTFGRFRAMQYGELSLRRILRGVGLGYPENCLLGVYERH